MTHGLIVRELQLLDDENDDSPMTPLSEEDWSKLGHKLDMRLLRRTGLGGWRLGLHVAMHVLRLVRDGARDLGRDSADSVHLAQHEVTPCN